MEGCRILYEGGWIRWIPAGSSEWRDGGAANAGTGLSSSPSLFSLRLPHCALSPFPDLEPARTSELRWRRTRMRGCSAPSSFPASSSAAALQRRLQLDPGTTMAALGFRFGIGLAGGLSQWARRWALGFFCFFQTINRGGRCNVPAVVKVYLPRRARYTARRGKSALPAAVKPRFTVASRPRRTALPAAENRKRPPPVKFL